LPSCHAMPRVSSNCWLRRRSTWKKRWNYRMTSRDTGEARRGRPALLRSCHAGWQHGRLRRLNAVPGLSGDVTLGCAVAELGGDVRREPARPTAASPLTSPVSGR
jgi:hypothetical protein